METPYKNALAAAKEGNNPVLLKIIKDNPDMGDKWKLVMSTAAGWGNADGLKMLLDIESNREESFVFNAALKASEKGHIDCLRLLAEHMDPGNSESELLKRAAQNGNSECVEFLLPHSNPNSEYGVALLNSIIGGHRECVKALAPVTNLKIMSSIHLQNAAKVLDRQILEMVWEKSDPKKALAGLKKARAAGECSQDALDFLTSVLQEKTLRSRNLNEVGISRRQARGI